MFTLLSGPFHPYLESTLVDTVQRMKAADPRTPLAIVVPSESLRRRLQWLLCVEHHCALFDVYFFTFHQLALHVDAEWRALSSPETRIPSREYIGDLFYEYVLSFILQQDSSTSNFFALHAESLGLCPALWQTIQDLQEAQVEPHVVLRGLQEGLFDETATQRLQELLKLHAVIQSWSRQLGVGLPDDLTHSIIPWIAHSPFISKLSAVFYYGFYDITQVQLSLLEEIARAKAVTVFFPLVSGQASQFAERFLDRHLRKAGVIYQPVQHHADPSQDEQSEVWSPNVYVVDAVGPEGELTFTCKSIVQYVEQNGYAWHEIGVVARNLEPYLPYVPRILTTHRIPFTTTATRPILEEPVAKVWWILAGLREAQFPWRDVLDVVTSPWYRSMANMEQSLPVSSHVWGQAIRHFRIVGGQEDWARLAHVAQDAETLQGWRQSSGGSLEDVSESLHLFAEIVGRLVADCLALPRVGSIRELTQAFETLIEKHLWAPTDHPSLGHDETQEEQHTCLMNGFEQMMTSMQQLDRLDRQVTEEEWTKVFRTVLERTRLPLMQQAQMGVQVLDVMTARGRPFRTLFVLGLNDHVFPRVVREDAFLCDRDRRVLAESLGYKIDEKMTGFDEEALLFMLLQQSAREHVYLLYQRADGNGRPLIPSAFLREYLCHTEVQSSYETRTFPVGLLQQSSILYFSPDNETPQECKVRAVLEGQSFQTMAFETSSWWKLFQNGMGVMADLERSGAKAGPFDGLTEANGLHWQDLVARGFSPTALGTYARCPMRYWMIYVLKIEGSREPMSKELPSRIWGELVHQVLCEVYHDLSRQGWPQRRVDSVQRATIVYSQVEQVFEDYARRFGKGYCLIWDWMRARLTCMMMALLEHDENDCIEQGWFPREYEVDATGVLPSEDHTQPELLKIHGRLDRIDEAKDHAYLRIVDYKVSMRRSFQTDELDLVTKALQGQQLQPPLYSFMAPMSLQPETEEDRVSAIPIHSVEFRYLRPMQGESVRSASFLGTVWETATGAQLKGAIYGWVQGVRAGQFFLLPGTYCRSCQYSLACRFQHHPSWSRAYGLSLAKTYRRIRKQKASND